MKVAVASSGKDEDSEVSPISGRAPYYLVYEDGKLIETIKNPFAIGGGGAGLSVAQMLSNKGVELVVSGRFGPKMEDALKAKGIKMKSEYNKKVKQVIEEL